MSDAVLPASETPTTACIVVPTFRRPAYLQVLLHELALVSIPTGLEIEVVVIDNDSTPSAKVIVDALRDSYPFRLAFIHCVEPGLSAVRNLTLDYANERFDFIYMIDDDEYPHRQWLCELTRVQRETQADIVVGPVLHKLPDNAPNWLRSNGFFELSGNVPNWFRTGGFYDVPSIPNGSIIMFGATNNCLISVASMRRLALRFDMTQNLTGGEDFFFFKELIHRGAKVVYASSAIVWEWVGPERQTIRFFLQLNFRRGNTIGLCERQVDGVASIPLRVAKELGRLVFGLATALPLTLLKGKGGAVWALCKIAFALGVFTGYKGAIYNSKARASA